MARGTAKRFSLYSCKTRNLFAVRNSVSSRFFHHSRSALVRSIAAQQIPNHFQLPQRELIQFTKFCVFPDFRGHSFCSLSENEKLTLDSTKIVENEAEANDLDEEERMFEPENECTGLEEERSNFVQIALRDPLEMYKELKDAPNSINYSTSLSPLQSLSSHKPITNPLYNFLPESKNPNNVVAHVCSSLKQKDHALLDYLKGQGLFSRFTSLEFSRILLRCQSDSSAALSFFNWVRNRLCLIPHAHSYCIMIHILVWSKNFKQAMKILLELVQLNANVSDCERVNAYESLLLSANDCNWDPVVFDMLIKAYLRKDMVIEGFQAFQKMVKLGFVPSIIATNCLLNGLSKMDYLGKCWEVYQEMLRIELRPNACTFNILTHILCKEGDMDKVNEFLERMEEEGFDLDTITYNMLIDGYCKNMRLKDAVYLYNIMCTRGVVPDLITYTTLINGSCKGGNVREAHRYFSLMVHRGLTADAVSYNTLIYGYCKEGMMQEARLVLFDMIRNKVGPDDFTCWLLIKGYQNLDRMISAVNLVVELARYGIMVSPDIYCYLILALCKDDRPFAAKSLLDQMSQNGYVPSAEVYNELIDSLSRGKFVKEAVELKIEMVSKGLKPKLSAYRSIIGGLCELSRSMEALSLMQEMIKSGLPLHIQICRSLVNGLCKEKNIFEVESLLSFYAKEFQIFDAECYNALVRVLSEVGEPSELIKFQDRMAKLGYLPNSLTCKYVIDGMWKAMKAQRRELLVE